MSPGPWARAVFLFLVVAVSLLSPSSSRAHAVLVESSPALKSSVEGPDVPLKLRFNVRIDAARSRLALVDPDGSSQTLEIGKQDSPEIISAEAKGLHPGLYSHIPLANLAVIAGWSRWLELRLPGENHTRAWMARLWPVCITLIGVFLLNYREM